MDKTWVYGALRVGDGHEVTMTAPSRNSANYQRFLGLVEQANPAGTIMVITDNLSSYTSSSTRDLAGRPPRIQHAFIPKRACWLNLQKGWWRLFRREALAGETFADPGEITLATRVATCRLNAVPARGGGADRHRPHATDGELSCTAFEERSNNKAGEGGCSVTVLEGTGGPWLLLAHDNGRVASVPWNRVRPDRPALGDRQPEPEKAPNATLRPDGTLVLSARYLRFS